MIVLTKKCTAITEQQKQLNREKSSVRVKCEHTRSGVKRYNAVKILYRNHIKDLDAHFMLCGTLEFLPDDDIS